MNYKAVIFDFDYTLGDSTKGIVECANYGLTKLGYPEADTDAIRKTVGLTLKDTFKTLSNQLDDQIANQFASLFKEKGDQIMTASTEMLPYALETLQSLKHQNMLTGIVTTKLHYRIDQILAKFDAVTYVDYIIGAEDVKIEKPNPEGLLCMIEQMALDKTEVLYVGDSLVDAATAQNAGVSFVGVLTGTTSRAEFEAYPNVAIIENLSKIQEVCYV